jgi:histidinol-phosphatase (PHP family)
MAGRCDGGPAPTLPGDYHVHTTYSDGAGSVEECVRQAVALGLPEVGIADHLSGVRHEAWDAAAIPFEKLDEYVAEVRTVAARHSDIKVLLGAEADYVAEHEAGFAELLSAYPFDYVAGGIHVLGGFDFDDPAKRDDHRWSDPDALFLAYYEAARRAAESGRFAFIAHLDYVGLWGHKPGPGVDAAIDAALDAMAASGTAIELNTDRVSDPAGIMYPFPDTLRRARERGIALVISSDAHVPGHVGRLWDEAIAMARQAGYRESLRLSDRALAPLPDV